MKTKIFSTEHARVSMKNSNRKKILKPKIIFGDIKKLFQKFYFQILKTTEKILNYLKSFKNPGLQEGSKNPHF